MAGLWFLPADRMYMRPGPLGAASEVDLLAFASSSSGWSSLLGGPSPCSRCTNARYPCFRTTVRDDKLSSSSVPLLTEFHPLIGTVNLADTRKSQPPIDYRPRAGLQKPPLRPRPFGRVRWLSRRVRQGFCGHRPRQTVIWVPND
ncbi:hypothetical protein DPMN_014840 [Dreissena polymorpha]|uniref:Uncharacterized protein n=1 Tax=Dreissena polymorpha TaxID=45954 RepID=A0A9D4N6R0_DREPO|nr:hypothetical protein DPMN_014840 [Dreissena polymorpha]